MLAPDELSYPHGCQLVCWSVAVTVTGSRQPDLNVLLVSNI